MKRALLIVGLISAAALVWWLTRPTAEPETASAPAPTPRPRPAPVQVRSPAPVAAPGVLVGRVVGAHGATVTARGEWGTASAEAWADGGFRLEVAPEQYLVSASAQGRASAVLGPFAVAAGQTLDVGTLEMLAAGSVTGLVRDATTRRPVAGARVVSSAGTAQTDGAGRFTLSNLPAGETWVEASANGYLKRMEWLTLAGAKAHSGLEIILRPAATLAGTVTQSGSPAAGARVWAEALDSSGGSAVLAAGQSDGEGKFLLQVEPGALALYAAGGAGGRVAGPTVSVAEGGRREGLSIELSQGSSVRGVLVVDGAPFPGGLISVLDVRSQAPAAVVNTDGTGHFEVPLLSAGRYLVQAQAGAKVGQRGPFETGGTDWTVELEEGAQLRGRVVPPAAGVVVRWRSPDWAGAAPAQTFTDAQGRFAFEGVPAGALTVEAEGPAGFARVRGAADRELVLELRPVTLKGAVYDAQGHAVTDFTVRATPVGAGPARSVPVLSPTGDFELPLSPGDYLVGAYATARGEAAAQRVSVAPGGAFVKLTLSATAPVSGRVLDGPSGLPLQGVEVAVLRARQGMQSTADRWATVTTDAGGVFEVGAVPEASVLLLRKEGFQPRWLWLPRAARGADGRLADVPLQRGAANPNSQPQSYEGIGMALDPRARPILVASVFSGSSAESAGVISGDVLLAVDGQDVSGLSLDQVIARIKGPAGTVVTLTLSRSGAPLVVPVRRRSIEF